MAITKILARRAGLDRGIDYVLNGDKTESQILTVYQNCDPGIAYREMTATKQRTERRFWTVWETMTFYLGMERNTKYALERMFISATIIIVITNR